MCSKRGFLLLKGIVVFSCIAIYDGTESLSEGGLYVQQGTFDEADRLVSNV